MPRQGSPKGDPKRATRRRTTGDSAAGATGPTPLAAPAGRAVAAAVTGTIRTILGDIPASALGRTLIHEHLICDLSTYWQPEDAPEVSGLQVSQATLRATRLNPFAVRDNLQLDGIDIAVAELAPYVAAGGSSLVEVTSHGIGRDIRAVEHVARASGVNVVVGTGYYIASSHPRGFERRPVADLVDELVEELTVGIGGRPARAGVIGELGVGSFPMRTGERHMLRAGARAQQATGAGMIVHPAPGIDSAFELVALLERSGAIMDKVVVSHLDERFRTDLRLFRRIGASGVRFGFDTFGREIYYPPRRKQHPNDTERIEAIARLWDAGLGDRIALAQDICIRHELAMFGGQGYSYVLDSIVPRLRHRGLPEEAIETMLVDTPARILALPGRTV